MIAIRKSHDRGHFNFGWLDTYHSFSFGDYHDSNHMGFRTLRVINEDVIEPGQGFPLHGHRDMEIITYILEGELEHRDSLGNIGKIQTGEFQTMTAGTGIRHSEYNASQKQSCHLLQIWILPNKKDLAPSYTQKKIEQKERLQLVAMPISLVEPKAQKQNLTLNQDVKLYLGRMQKSEKQSFVLSANRHAWIQMIRGSLLINGNQIEPGDGAAISSESQLLFECVTPCEFLAFDLN